MSCERHDSLESDIERMRDNLSDLYEKHRDHDARLVCMEERMESRGSDITRLEIAVTRLEALIHDISNKLNELKNAPAQKVAGRVAGVMDKLMWLAISGAIGVLATLLIKGGI